MSKNKTKHSEHGVQVRGLAAVAKNLGVSRVTLWRAINGKTNSPELMSRYRAQLSLQTAHQPTK